MVTSVGTNRAKTEPCVQIVWEVMTASANQALQESTVRPVCNSTHDVLETLHSCLLFMTAFHKNLIHKK